MRLRGFGSTESLSLDGAAGPLGKSGVFLVFETIGTRPAGYDRLSGFLAENGELVATGENTPFHSAVTETVRGDDALIVALGRIVAREAGRWSFHLTLGI